MQDPKWLDSVKKREQKYQAKRRFWIEVAAKEVFHIKRRNGRDRDKDKAEASGTATSELSK